MDSTFQSKKLNRDVSSYRRYIEVSHLTIIISLIDEELLSTGRWGDAHPGSLVDVAGVVTVVSPSQPGLVPDKISLSIFRMESVVGVP